MKKTKNILILLIGLCSIFTINVYGEEKDNYFTADNDVIENNIVNHSLFTAGDSVLINSKVKGIHLIAGNNINIKGNAEYHMLAGNTVNFSGNSKNDLFIAGNNINLLKESTIGRDVYIAGNNVNINADIKGNMFITASNVTINSTLINGNLSINANNITISDTTTIKGTLNYNEQATTKLNTANINAIEKTKEVETTPDQTSEIIAFLISFLTLLVVASTLNFIFPKISNYLANTKFDKKIGKTLLKGLAILVLSPIISLLLLITVIAVPLGIINFVIYIIACYLSFAITSIYLGKLLSTKIFKEAKNSYLEILIGVIFAKIISLIPILNIIYIIFAILLGLGLMLNMFLTFRKEKV